MDPRRAEVALEELRAAVQASPLATLGERIEMEKRREQQEQRLAELATCDTGIGQLNTDFWRCINQID